MHRTTPPLLQKVYADFGFNNIIYKVATRPQQRIGSDESWDKAEQALMQSLRSLWSRLEMGRYGPKIEYTLKDALGRPWQCGTMQVDFFMTERLDASYTSVKTVVTTGWSCCIAPSLAAWSVYRHFD